MKRVFTFSVFILTSCMATQKDMIILQSQIDDLNSNIFTLKKNQADLTSKIDDLNRTLISFTENSKDLSSEMNKLSVKIEEYGNMTDKKINQIGKNLASTSKEEDEPTKQSKHFTKALNAYSSGKLKMAKELFRDYISLYPRAENIDSAYFYLAETLYSEDNFREAAILYAKIISEYPSFYIIEHIKFKYALSLIEMNDPSKIKEAENYLEDLIKNSKDKYLIKSAKSILNDLSSKKQIYNKKSNKKDN